MSGGSNSGRAGIYVGTRRSRTTGTWSACYKGSERERQTEREGEYEGEGYHNSTNLQQNLKYLVSMKKNILWMGFQERREQKRKARTKRDRIRFTVRETDTLGPSTLPPSLPPEQSFIQHSLLYLDFGRIHGGRRANLERWRHHQRKMTAAKLGWSVGRSRGFSRVPGSRNE